jgi:hypothetical protein
LPKYELPVIGASKIIGTQEKCLGLGLDSFRDFKKTKMLPVACMIVSLPHPPPLDVLATIFWTVSLLFANT